MVDDASGVDSVYFDFLLVGPRMGYSTPSSLELGVLFEKKTKHWKSKLKRRSRITDMPAVKRARSELRPKFQKS